MKHQKIFENVGGNQFRLLTESVKETIKGSELVREGLKKVFANGGKEISYKVLENVGLGYIKDVTTAKKCALQESSDIAPEYGYTPDNEQQRFVKSEQHSESDMSNPEEAREVQIGKRLLTLASQSYGNKRNEPEGYAIFKEITSLAQELIQMHGTK